MKARWKYAIAGGLIAATVYAGIAVQAPAATPSKIDAPSGPLKWGPGEQPEAPR